jgi:MOSC domain-containing protein YiiM
MSKGKVLELFMSIKGQENRANKEEILLDENGVVGDKFHGKNIERSILITSQKSYDLAHSNDVEMPYGSLGENIIIDIDPYNLSSGDKIEMGEVILEITNNCTICNGLSKVDSSLPKLLADDRGIFAKTIQGGYIRKGDVVNILKYQ